MSSSSNLRRKFLCTTLQNIVVEGNYTFAAKDPLLTKKEKEKTTPSLVPINGSLGGVDGTVLTSGI